MPEFHLADSIITSLNAQEPWPDNVKLFQPYEVEQILLPDNASCLAVQAFLKMCNLPFEVEMRWNAEFMSPSGRVPFIKCGAFVVSELEPIVQFAANKGVTLCSDLTTEEKAEMRAYMSLITNVLVNAELYISWIDSETYNAVTKVRNSSVYPWPLGWLQTRAKRTAVAKRLRALHWHDKTLDQVLADVEQCCNSLSQRLGDRDYFFGNSPTAVDALVFGHMRALLSADGPKAAVMIKPITTSLLKHLQRMLRPTKMTLTPQEEYLVSQAFLVSRRAPSAVGGERPRRSKLCLRSARDDVTYNRDRDRDVYGFKPFASKQIKIMSSKEGGVTCSYGPSKSAESRSLVRDLIDDVLDKVTSVVDSDGRDFVMVYANVGDAKLLGDDFLDTIEEHVADGSDADPRPVAGGAAAQLRYFEQKTSKGFNYGAVTPPRSVDKYEERECDSKRAGSSPSAHSFKDKYEHDSSYRAARAFKDRAEIVSSAQKLDENDFADTKYGDGERVADTDCAAPDSGDPEMFHIIHDESDDLLEDSDGMVTDKHLASRSVTNCDDTGNHILDSDSSKNKERKGGDSLTSNGSRISTEKSERTAMSSRSGSKCTLKVPSDGGDEEISVESLLRHLRERNATYWDTLPVADVD